MTDLDAVTHWVTGYTQAWNTNDPADIRDLFTEDAEYATEPFRPPWRGHDQIVKEWLARKDAPGETSFQWNPVAVTPDVAIIQGTTTYPTKTFSNLWILRLTDSGHCSHFTEWWMEHPSEPSGDV